MAILKIAHRGASGWEPENTFSAFDKALEIGVDMIECDVRLCKSGELVVMHDNKTERMTGIKAKISSLTLEEIKKLRVAGKYEIPTLEEVIKKYADKTQIMVDVKSGAAAAEIVRLIKKYKTHPKILITSTNQALLLDIVMRDPEIRTSISFDIYSYAKYLFVKKLFVLPAKLVGANTVNVYHKFVQDKMVERAHKYGLKINVYAPDQLEDIEYFKKIGVDGIISNYPDKI